MNENIFQLGVILYIVLSLMWLIRLKARLEILGQATLETLEGYQKVLRYLKENIEKK